MAKYVISPVRFVKEGDTINFEFIDNNNFVANTNKADEYYMNLVFNEPDIYDGFSTGLENFSFEPIERASIPREKLMKFLK